MPGHHLIRRALTLGLVSVALLAAAAPAPGQQSPFAPLPSAPSNSQQAPAPTTTTTQDNGGLDSWQIVLLSIGGLLLIAGIVFGISRDARQSVRNLGGNPDSGEDRPRPDAHRSAQRAKRKQRQKDKAARAQRRRNR